jgi:hypothetical protein
VLHAVADEALAVEEAVEEHACRSHRHLHKHYSKI